jgi:hypothetical protein
MKKKSNVKDDNKPGKKLVELLNDILKKYSITEIADKINLSPSTVSRWIELKNIPKTYEFDLLKLLSIKIDYSQYTSKEKAQFFTPVTTAKYCYDTFCKVIKELCEKESEYNYIEPSAGDGSFLKVLPKDRVIAMDIEPKNENIITQDYLEWKPTENKKYTVFGNPPFGLRGHLALRFINHSYKFADFVCFILPQLFESDGKGVPRKRVEGFNLIHSEKLNTHFYEPDTKKNIDVNTIFQIWSKNHVNEKYNLIVNNNEILKIYSLSDGGTSSTTRNKKMKNKCDIYLPSTCFGKENMKYYDSFEDLPGKKGYGLVFFKDKKNLIEKAKSIKWNEIAFLSTNSAYNLRSSQIHLQIKI